MQKDKARIVGIGEILWDCFPEEKHLGGAPANFTYHATALGHAGIVATRIGNDELGNAALKQLHDAGIDTTWVQTDDTHITGRVDITLDSRGQASYRFAEDTAWDHLCMSEEWEALARTANAVCFGTLAQRSRASRAAIHAFLQQVPLDALRICDINLRGNFYDDSVVLASLSACNVLKMNEEELPILCEMLGIASQDERTALSIIRNTYDLRLLCYTRSDRGSCFVTADACCDHPGFRVTVGDTVGAGDAFTAAVADGLLRNLPLDAIALHASKRGAWVATQKGAMPPAHTFDPEIF